MADKKSIPLWIKKDGRMYSVSEDLMKTFSSYQAISVAVDTYKELKKQMLIDSLNKKDRLIKNINVCYALNNSLNKLHELFPELVIQDQINYYTNSSIN